MAIIQRYTTRLETAKGDEIVPIINAKLEATSPEQTVDYIGFAIDNLDSTLERIKQAEKELKALKAEAEIQKEIIKTGTSLWLAENGITSLKGDRVSSISIFTPNPKEELKVTSEEALINAGYFKTSVDKTAVKNAIKDGVDVDGAEIEITHLSDSLRLNKKRNDS